MSASLDQVVRQEVASAPALVVPPVVGAEDARRRRCLAAYERGFQCGFNRKILAFMAVHWRKEVISTAIGALGGLALRTLSARRSVQKNLDRDEA